MRGVWAFLRRDARHAVSSAIALVVFAGIVAVPSFYAWFNIAGSWDPYGNTRNLRVAVANEDAGYEGGLLPVRVNMGERVVSDLRASESIGYEIASADDAVEGVRSGEYFAAIVIPEDFSRDMMGVLSGTSGRPQVSFYQNEKENAIATIVTDKASAAAQADIDASFARSVASVGAGVLDELSRALDDDGVTSLAARLGSAVADAEDSLAGTADDVRGFSELLASTRGLLGSGADAAESALSPAAGAGDALRETASGLAGAGSAIDGAATSVEGALASAGAGLDGVDDAIDDALSAAEAQSARVRDLLDDARAAADGQASSLDALASALGEQAALMGQLEETLPEGAARDRVAAARERVQGLAGRVTQAADEMRDLSQGLRRTMSDLDAGAADAGAARQELAGLVGEARAAIDEVRGSYNADVRGVLEELATQVGDAARGAEGTLGDAQTSLDETADAIEKSAGRLGDLRERLSAALASGDVEQVRRVLAADPSELADFVAAPVDVERTVIFPVENNGSAMAPVYTTLAIWIGGVVLCALVRATPSAEALAETGCSHAQAYVGRLLLFCAVGLAQAALICGGDLFYLGVQCVHPWLLLLACLASSLVYVNLIFSLTASFGDVGKAVAVVLMVVQVAGSGGTFPPQMLPPAFQAVYAWLPFVHSENAMRAAMFGVWEGDIWRELAVLLAYLVPALLLGLVLRRPVIRLNERLEERLEKTRLM